MKEKPLVTVFDDGSRIWEHEFVSFRVKVYVPNSELPCDIINYGFDAPYLLVFEEKESDIRTVKEYADLTGLALIAQKSASSVVFVYPTCEGAWKNASEELWKELIEKSRIHEFYEDGFAILNNRFTKMCDGYAIRGAIFRTFIFSAGASADYVADKLLRTINGAGLWGPADVTLTGCVLENTSAAPVILRRDIPIVSVSNSDEIDNIIKRDTDYSFILKDAYEASEQKRYDVIFDKYLKNFMRWGWVGELSQTPGLSEQGMVEEAGIVNVKTSCDNVSDAATGKDRHDIGYLAYYNKDLFMKGSASLVLCFHGGGDSAKHIAKVSEWYKVAKDHDFLLVCIENHLNSTATEMMELIDSLCERYDIDKTEIYATGFSMGGCKSWDLYQEYPQFFAGIAPMDATFDVGCNVFGNKVGGEINRDCIVPIFYAGGEVTPLPELPFQAQKCLDRMKYVFEVNKVVKDYDVKLEDVEKWENPIWGINGDRIEKFYDSSRDATLTVHYFDSEDGNCYSAFGSISEQAHECRHHTCEQAWLFVSQFARNTDGRIVRK